MAILTRTNEICEPLDDSLLARHAKSFGQRSGNTSGIGSPVGPLCSLPPAYGLAANGGGPTVFTACRRVGPPSDRSDKARRVRDLPKSSSSQRTYYFVGSRRLVRSVPTMIVPVNPPS